MHEPSSSVVATKQFIRESLCMPVYMLVNIHTAWLNNMAGTTLLTPVTLGTFWHKIYWIRGTFLPVQHNYQRCSYQNKLWVSLTIQRNKGMYTRKGPLNVYCNINKFERNWCLALLFKLQGSACRNPEVFNSDLQPECQQVMLTEFVPIKFQLLI